MTNDMETTDLLDIAKNIPTIKELYKKRDELQSQVNELDGKIKLLLSSTSRSGRRKGAFESYEHPNEGTIGYDIVEILSSKEVMSREEIQNALERKKGESVSEHTIRSYLTNFKCFQRHSKNLWKYNGGE